MKTHCKNGHPMTPDNIRVKGKYKYCRTCLRAYARNWARRKVNKGVVLVEPEVSVIAMRDIPGGASEYWAARGSYAAAIRRAMLLPAHLAVRVEFPPGTVSPSPASVVNAAKSLGVNVGQRWDVNGVCLWIVRKRGKAAA